MHLLGGLEILLAGELAHALGVAQYLPVGNADTGLMGLKVLGRGELHRVRCHDGQCGARRKLHGCCDMGFIVDAPGPLQFQIKPVREDATQLQRHFHGPRRITLQQGLTHRPSLRAGERNQPLVQLLQPRQLDDCLVLHHVLGVAARQQLGQIQVTLLVLHQQNHARQGCEVTTQAFEKNLDPQHRLGALGARLLVELDGAEQVAQVGDGQGRLAIGHRRGYGVINSVGSINDGKFGVQAQVYKHAPIVVLCDGPRLLQGHDRLRGQARALHPGKHGIHGHRFDVIGEPLGAGVVVKRHIGR